MPSVKIPIIHNPIIHWIQLFGRKVGFSFYFLHRDRYNVQFEMLIHLFEKGLGSASDFALCTLRFALQSNVCDTALGL